MINTLPWNRIDSSGLPVCVVFKFIFLIDVFLAPTHAILAFKSALDELEGEGGVAGRANR